MDWLSTARECYESSTTYVDANYRKKWEYSLRAFQNEHAPGSKYLSDEYKGRSKLFRPKTRSVIRKGEAAAFMTIGNLDDLSIQAEDPDNLFAVAGAEAMRAVLRYRLSKSIPWPLLAAGAYQDAASVGVVCSYNYWEYEQRDGRVVKDKPCIELRPVENIRIDPGAKWYDPVNTSPYYIDIIPMYVCDVKSMMSKDDPKTGLPKWKKYDDKTILQGMPDMLDSTRQVRQGRAMEDPHQVERSLKEHDIVWVMKFFMRQGADDFCFYTLGTHALLTDPKPVADVYWHGQRPYTMGCVVLETHKAMPDGPTWMSRDLQREMNENVNSRIDNVKLVLNKRYLVGRGRQVDVQSLLRNVPGGVTMMTDPKGDVVPLEWNDVTQSAYVEQDKLGQDFDDLVGNFSPNTRFANVGMSETLGGSKMAAAGASAMTEYQIHTLIKTWVEPTLRQLMLLEQYYETDEKILALAGKSVAQAFPQFGSTIPDTMLMQELVLSVDFGMGATDPQARLQKFLVAMNAASQIVQTAPPGANVQEAIKEVFRNAGYRDGARFFPSQQDPRLVKAFGMVQQLQAQLADKRFEIETRAQVELQKAMLSKQATDSEIAVNARRIDMDASIRADENRIRDKEVDLDFKKAIIQVASEDEDRVLKRTELVVRAAESDAKSTIENGKLTSEQEKMRREQERADRETQAQESNEQRISQVAQGVAQAVQQVGTQMTELKQDLDEAKRTAEQVTKLQEAMLAMAQGVAALSQNMHAMGNKPKPKGWKKKMVDGRKSIVIVMENGDEMEMMEQ